MLPLYNAAVIISVRMLFWCMKQEINSVQAFGYKIVYFKCLSLGEIYNWSLPLIRMLYQLETRTKGGRVFNKLTIE